MELLSIQPTKQVARYGLNRVVRSAGWKGRRESSGEDVTQWSPNKFKDKLKGEKRGRVKGKVLRRKKNIAGVAFQVKCK